MSLTNQLQTRNYNKIYLSHCLNFFFQWFKLWCYFRLKLFSKRKAGLSYQTRITIKGEMPKGIRQITIHRRKKKMAAVHFTTTPCESNTALLTSKHKESHIFAIFVAVLKTFCTLRLSILQLFFCTFLWALLKFSSTIGKIMYQSPSFFSRWITSIRT